MTGKVLTDFFKGCDQRETFWLTGKENGVFEPDEKFDITDVGVTYSYKIVELLLDHLKFWSTTLPQRTFLTVDDPFKIDFKK